MIPSPKKPNLAMSALYAAPGMCDNLHSMKPAVLVTKRIFPEAIAYLKEHAELDYAESDDGMRDRKSTRLNSSHLGISYAVFCLKKKNHRTQADEQSSRSWFSRINPIRP